MGSEDTSRTKTAQIRLERRDACPLNTKHTRFGKGKGLVRGRFELYKVFVIGSITGVTFKSIRFLREADEPQYQTLTIQAFIILAFLKQNISLK